MKARHACPTRRCRYINQSCIHVSPSLPQKPTQPLLTCSGRGSTMAAGCRIFFLSKGCTAVFRQAQQFVPREREGKSTEELIILLFPAAAHIRFLRRGDLSLVVFGKTKKHMCPSSSGPTSRKAGKNGTSEQQMTHMS